MSYAGRYKFFTFSGSLAEPIEKYINEKRGVGRLFNKQSQMLASLDRLSVSLGCTEASLTRELAEAWILLRPNESRKNQRYRLNCLKLFANFMIRYGYKAYIPTVTISTKDDKIFTPYIFSESELEKIFTVFDNWRHSRQYPNSHIVLPILMQTLYCCGLRVSEAAKLRLKDVDLKMGVLYIKNAKHDKSRLVPMAPDLTEKYSVYVKVMHTFSEPNAIFFPNSRRNSHNERMIYHIFREALCLAGITHGGKGNGPRLHDLRHTFAVHCLVQWMEAGVDVMAALPYLSAYLGHFDIYGTQKYLRITELALPHLIKRMNDFAGDIIPRLEVSHEEK